MGDPALPQRFTSLDDIATAVHQLAWEKGWHDTTETEDHFIERSCNNLHGEVCELYEAWRNNKLHEECDKADGMRDMGDIPLSCLEEELADIIIRALDCARKLNVDIGQAIYVKHIYNSSRTNRHGGKRS